MKIIIFLGLLGATSSAPLVPQRLTSASNSNEGPLSSWIPPFSGFLQQQQQQQTPFLGRPPLSMSALDRFMVLFPNQVPFSRQVGLTQGNQAGQLDPSQPQTPSQTQQAASQMSYVISFKMPQDQTQMLQYYPVYRLLPWEQFQQTVTQSPQQTGQQLFEEQIPFYAQFEYIPQQAESGVPGGQQNSGFDTPRDTTPANVAMPAEGTLPHLQKEMIGFRRDSARAFMPSTLKPSPADLVTPTIDTTMAPVLPEEKRKGCDGTLEIF